MPKLVTGQDKYTLFLIGNNNDVSEEIHTMQCFNLECHWSHLTTDWDNPKFAPVVDILPDAMTLCQDSIVNQLKVYHQIKYPDYMRDYSIEDAEINNTDDIDDTSNQLDYYYGYYSFYNYDTSFEAKVASNKYIFRRWWMEDTVSIIFPRVT